MSGDQDWSKTLQVAFPAEFDRIIQTVHNHPQTHQGDLLRLFLDLAVHVPVANGATPANPKKRKLEDGSSMPTQPKHETISDPIVCFECKDVSFQVPLRKKLKLQLVEDGSNRRNKEIRLLNQQTSEVEHTLPIEAVEQVFCLPVPDKQQRQWNFCIFPKTDATSPSGTPYEQVVFTMNESKPAAGSITLENPQVADNDTADIITQSALNQRLHSFGKRVIMPNPDQFSSSIPQPHRKGEKAYHVKAHRGSKEGYLFFLENGIVFGFKRPLAFFPFSCIGSVSYTSVLQRTFNLNIAVVGEEGDGGEEKELEFSMLDQADFAGIDEYIKKHELNDASMAAERRAKVYNVNKKKEGENGEEDGVKGDEEGVVHQKTEQELQDEEDEEEEDYEASGGESDGEGEDSDEEEGDGEEGYDEDGGGEEEGEEDGEGED